MDLKVFVFKTSKLLILLLLFVVAYSLLYGFADLASAPLIEMTLTDGNQSYDSADKSGAVKAEYLVDSDNPGESSDPGKSSDPPVTPLSPAQIPSDPPIQSGSTYVQDDFITFRMNDPDIHSGALIIVNSSNYFEIPEECDLVYAVDVNTGSYRVDDDNIKLDASIIDALNDMMDAFYMETGRDSITVISGFRTYEKQQEILDEYIKLFGTREAHKWAATPGNSEHHTGLALDIGIFNGTTVRTFTGMGVNAWFKENCYKFGFILRYTQEKTDITGTADEPWHFRYVGNPHAYLMYHNAWCFEEYMDFIRNYSVDEPYSFLFIDEVYNIYHTTDMEIMIPFDCEFDISGDNIDGFIVTIKPAEGQETVDS